MKSAIPLFLALLLLPACAKKQDTAHVDEHSAEPQRPERPASAARDLLHVDPSMLRDLNITTAKVEQRTGGESTAMLGELRVNEAAYAEIGAPVPGRVVDLHANPGDSVRTGQPLATLQSVELGNARAAYIKAQSRVTLAEKALGRKRRLAGERIVAQRDVQEAEAELDYARAEMRAAEAELNALGSDATAMADSPRYTLRSPLSGTVIERQAVRGQMADPSHALFRVGDLSTLWLTVQAFERDALRVKPGTVARVTFPAIPGQAFTGKVTYVGRMVQTDSRTIPVRIDIANRDGRLRPGMSATAFLLVGQGGDTILSVPAPALQRMQERWVVFVPGAEEDEFEIRDVGRGRDLGGEVEILSGLEPGENIVLEGAFMLKAQAEKAHGGAEEHEH